MKKEKKETIQVHRSVYSSPIYEMEVWADYKSMERTDEVYKQELKYQGRMSCGITSLGVGYFPTYEWALEHYEMMTEDDHDGYDIVAMQIRQKPMLCILGKDEYIKEWSFRHGLLIDESIVRNYDEDYYKFYGRPEEMIHHKVGDIVQFYDGSSWIWGIVCALPPTEESVNKINRKATEQGLIKQNDSLLDWSDDSYTILTNNGGYMASHEHIPVHHVFTTMLPVPDYVRNILNEGLTKS